LSPGRRERDIVDRKTNRQIAEALHVSPKTVGKQASLSPLAGKR
jgi:DNA-binding NarL/FixJ family response regulator